MEYIAHSVKQNLAQSTVNGTITAVVQAIAATQGINLSDSVRLQTARRNFAKHRPRVARYDATFDINKLLWLVKSWGSNSNLTIDKLRRKVIVLLKLDLMARSDDIAKIFRHPKLFKINEAELSLQLYRTKECTELTTPIHVAAYPIDEAICTVKAVHEYLERTRSIAEDCVKLQIGGKEIHTCPLILRESDGTPLGSERISKLTLQTMLEAGIESKFKSHATRSAAISKAIAEGASMSRVQLHARMKSERVLHNHYLRVETGNQVTSANSTDPLSHILRHSFSNPANQGPSFQQTN